MAETFLPPCKSDVTPQTEHVFITENVPDFQQHVTMCVCVQVREMLAETMHQVVEMVTGSKVEAEEVLNERADLSQHRCYRGCTPTLQTELLQLAQNRGRAAQQGSIPPPFKSH